MKMLKMLKQLNDNKLFVYINEKVGKLRDYAL